jgi:hypothetical protein
MKYSKEASFTHQFKWPDNSVRLEITAAASWNCQNLAAEQLLPGMAVSTVYLNTNHTCWAILSSSSAG